MNQETSMGELRQWCEARAMECGTKAQDPAIAERLQLGWAMSADAFVCVIEKIDDMNPANASDGRAALEPGS